MSDHVFAEVDLTIKPGELDNFKALASEMVDATRANEPDALNYEYYISADGTQGHIYERYADSAAVMTHMQHFAAFAERFNSVVEMTAVRIYGNASDEVKELVGGLGAVFMAPLDGFAR
jgi:quinol monooxygenase YgiN